MSHLLGMDWRKTDYEFQSVIDNVKLSPSSLSECATWDIYPAYNPQPCLWWASKNLVLTLIKKGGAMIDTSI